ncbi:MULTISPECIES: hypothetical protein [Nostocales]|uniref:Transposase n=2 Tax=Nostocales TaxID=1161 RepID=A0ABW8WII4_9CYAN|nr:hypothetical protein [Tolypothrix bouteillei]
MGNIRLALREHPKLETTPGDVRDRSDTNKAYLHGLLFSPCLAVS